MEGDFDQQSEGFEEDTSNNKGLDLNGLAADPSGQDNGFDYQENQQNAFEDDRFGGMDQDFGLDQEDNLLAMEEELNNANQNVDGGAQDTFEITLSIVFDEDDNNSHKLNLNDIFQADPKHKCYQQKVSNIRCPIDIDLYYSSVFVTTITSKNQWLTVSTFSTSD